MFYENNMKIQYTGNTCDIDEVDNFGEIEVFFKDGKIVHHHDYSDGALEIDHIQSLLTAIGADVEFEYVRPDEKQVKEINKYLKKHY
jgi:hypothetical protein